MDDPVTVRAKGKVAASAEVAREIELLDAPEDVHEVLLRMNKLADNIEDLLIAYEPMDYEQTTQWLESMRRNTKLLDLLLIKAGYDAT